MYWVIDRFEEGFALLENTIDQTILQLARETLPPDAREGDVVVRSNGVYILDRAETEERAKRIKARFERLKRRGQRK